MAAMNSFDPKICFDAWDQRPPQSRKLFTFDNEEMGWWIADYLPNEEFAEYQPRAWHLAGLEFYRPFVTHSMFLPPAPERTNYERPLG